MRRAAAVRQYRQVQRRGAEAAESQNLRKFVPSKSAIADNNARDELGMVFSMQSKLLLTLLAVVMTAGCSTTTYVLVGSRRPPISSDEVIVYGRPPAAFEEVAILDANTKQSWTFSEQSQLDLVIERLKKIAASLGANGILFQGASNEYAGSVAFGNTSFHRNSILSIAGAIPLSAKVGHGVAIYVAPGSSASAASAPTIAEALPQLPPPTPRVASLGTTTATPGSCRSLGVDVTKLPVTAMGGIDGVTGAMISRVLPNSPAAAAGIRKGDIVVRVGDSPIDDPDDIRNAICRVPAGSIIDVKVSREARPMWLSVQF